MVGRGRAEDISAQDVWTVHYIHGGEGRRRELRDWWQLRTLYCLAISIHTAMG